MDLSAESSRICQRRLGALALALTTVCVQYSTALTCMAGPGSSRGDRAKWNEAEINGMLDYLDQHKSAMGEAGNFKALVYNSVAEHITQHLTVGPAKTGKMVKSKWQSVRHPHTSFIC